MTAEDTGTATLYQHPDGRLSIVNTGHCLAWSLWGYIYPGRAFNDLLNAAQGTNPRYATGCSPTPELAAFPPDDSQAIATVAGDRYIVFWQRANAQARIYLGFSLTPNLQSERDQTLS